MILEKVQLPKVLSLEKVVELKKTISQKQWVLFVGASDRVFCGGADINVFVKGGEVEITQYFQELKEFLLGITNLSVSAALVDGLVAGGGVGIIGACDLVLGTPNISVVLPEHNLRFGPFLVSVFLKRRLQRNYLKELSLLAQPKDLKWCVKAGLVDIAFEQKEQADIFAQELGEHSISFLQSLRKIEDVEKECNARINQVVKFLMLPETKQRLADYLARLSKGR